MAVGGAGRAAQITSARALSSKKIFMGTIGYVEIFV